MNVAGDAHEHHRALEFVDITWCFRQEVIITMRQSTICLTTLKLIEKKYIEMNFSILFKVTFFFSAVFITIAF